MPAKFVVLCLEVVFLLLVLLYYKRLKRYGLRVVLPIVVTGLIIDVIFNWQIKQYIYYNYNTFELMSLVLGTIYFRPLKSYRLLPLWILILLYFIADILAGVYQVKGWHNIHIWNNYYLVASAVIFFFFFLLLQLNKSQAVAYIIFVILIFLVCCIEWISNEHPRESKNIITVIIFTLYTIVFSGLIISRIVISPSSDRIHYEPHFWIFAGLIIDGLIEAVQDSVHQYLLLNLDQLDKFSFLLSATFFARSFLDICFFISIVLCVRRFNIERQLIPLQKP